MGHPEPLTQHPHNATPATQGQKSPSANSLSMSISMGLIRDELLQPGALRLQLLQPFRVAGFHPAVLREPPMPRRLRDLMVPAHLIKLPAASQKPVTLSQFA